MFLRIDSDTFVNIDNIFSYKLSDEGDSFKLTLWGTSGTVMNTIHYMKFRDDHIALLKEVVNSLRDITINPERETQPEIETGETQEPEEVEPVTDTREERNRHLREMVKLPDEAVEAGVIPGQMSLFDN